MKAIQDPSSAPMSPILVRYAKHALGDLVMGVYEEQVCLLDFRYRKMRSTVDLRIQTRLQANFVERAHPLHQHVIEQLDLYLQGKTETFDFPIKPAGSTFQLSVWRALMDIPYGATRTYAQLASDLGAPSAIRAVAAANGANALAIVIPCHRVIGSDGSLTGYGGGLSLKKRLLTLEQTPSLF